MRIQTLSGSIYGLGGDRWTRVGRVPILGDEDLTSGPYHGEPVVMGQSMRLMTDDGHFIVTTPVVNAEVTDTERETDANPD